MQTLDQMPVIKHPYESAGFQRRELDEQHAIYTGSLPDELKLSSDAFDELWRLHPDQYPVIRMRGRAIKTPHWQQAYERDYRYTGQINRAVPIPAIVQPYLAWSQAAIDRRLNGVLVNWYDGSLGHYIGRHRDSTIGMTWGAPIVTISLGEERVFRQRPYRGRGYHDFPAHDGAVFIVPYETNLSWTHEVPKQKSCLGRRISITVRGFSA